MRPWAWLAGGVGVLGTLSAGVILWKPAGCGMVIMIDSLMISQVTITPEMVLNIVLMSSGVTALVALWTGLFRVRQVVGPVRAGGRWAAGRLMVVLLGLLLIESIMAGVVQTGWFRGLLGDNPPKTELELAIYAVSMMAWGLLVWLMIPDGFAKLGIWPIKWRNLWRGPVNIVVALPWVLLIGLVGSMVYTAMFHKEPVAHEILQEISQPTTTPWHRLLAILSAAVGAPLLEEAMFRGTLQTMFVSILTLSRPVPGSTEELPPMMGQVRGRWVAIGITAALFALMHAGNQPTFVPALFLLAVVIGYTYERTGNYWVAVLMHAIFNGVNLAMASMGGGEKAAAQIVGWLRS